MLLTWAQDCYEIIIMKQRYLYSLLLIKLSWIILNFRFYVIQIEKISI